MGIFKRFFDSISGNPDVTTKSTNTVPSRHFDSVDPRSAQELLSRTSETALSSSTDRLSEHGQAPPSVIFQPVAEPEEDTNSFLEEVAGAFDDAFDRACSGEAELADSSTEATRDEQSEAAVRELFVEIAANYATPLKSFMFELQRGTAGKHEIELCRPVLDGIRGAVEIMNFPQAAERMSDIDDAFQLALDRNEQLVRGEIRQRILSTYGALVQIMPEAFRLGDDGQRREDLIIKSLLNQIPGLGCVTLEKLYKAGLGSLNALSLANREDLAAATGISRRMSGLICE